MKESTGSLRHYQIEGRAMASLMSQFVVTLSNGVYEARHTNGGKVVGVGRLPIEAAGDWIAKAQQALSQEFGHE